MADHETQPAHETNAAMPEAFAMASLTGLDKRQNDPRRIRSTRVVLKIIASVRSPFSGRPFPALRRNHSISFHLSGIHQGRPLSTAGDFSEPATASGPFGLDSITFGPGFLVFDPDSREILVATPVRSHSLTSGPLKGPVRRSAGFQKCRVLPAIRLPG